MSEYLSESASESAMGSEVAETEVSAFNSSAYENSQKVTTDRNSKSKNGHNSSHNSADIDASQQTDASKRGELSYESGGSQRQNYADTDRFHKYGEMAHIHGNIGVMEATTMIEHAVAMYRDIDVYKLIAYMFEKEFLIQLY